MAPRKIDRTVKTVQGHGHVCVESQTLGEVRYELTVVQHLKVSDDYDGIDKRLANKRIKGTITSVSGSLGASLAGYDVSSQLELKLADGRRLRIDLGRRQRGRDERFAVTGNGDFY